MNRAMAILLLPLGGCTIITALPPISFTLDGGEPVDSGPCPMVCSGGTPVCDVDAGQCVGCTSPEQCNDNDVCTVDRCDLNGECAHTVDETVIADIAAGGDHTCALSCAGTVQCWGANTTGELGNGFTSTTPTSTPVSVMSLSDAAEISAGTLYTCARRLNGFVACWGDNFFGELGDGTIDSPRLTPIAVVGLSDATSIAAGAVHTCALRATGGVACWGTNNQGQLGDGSMTVAMMPVQVSGVGDATGVDVGGVGFGDSHSCAVRATGSIVCWGGNGDGQLGDATMAPRLFPVPAVDLVDAIGITAGESHSCAVRSGRGVVCWGANDSGQLGDGSMTGSATPIVVAGLAGAAEVQAGALFTCARLESGAVQCWGSNSSGQLGNGMTVDSSTPVDVTGLSDAVLLAVGRSHACARRASGEVVCWGAGSSGQLGDGMAVDQSMPVIVTGL